jgi:hypothetical protein
MRALQLNTAVLAVEVAAWVVITTLRAVIGSPAELLWPENVSYGHPTGEQRV